MVNILSQFGHALSLFRVLSLNLWRARCRHNIPASLNIAECVSQTTSICYSSSTQPSKNTNPRPKHRPRSNQLSQHRPFPCGPGPSPRTGISSSFQPGVAPPFYPSCESSAVRKVRWPSDPPDASSVPDSATLARQEEHSTRRRWCVLCSRSACGRGTRSEFMSKFSSRHPPPMDDSRRISAFVAAAERDFPSPFFSPCSLGFRCEGKPFPWPHLLVSRGFLFYNPLYH